jgi:glycine cleavage system aminomethyltransferase T
VHAVAGELGWEIYMKMEDMARLYGSLLDNGSDLQLEHFGSRVINTLRIEKGEHLGKKFLDGLRGKNRFLEVSRNQVWNL